MRMNGWGLGTEYWGLGDNHENQDYLFFFRIYIMRDFGLSKLDVLL